MNLNKIQFATKNQSRSAKPKTGQDEQTQARTTAKPNNRSRHTDGPDETGRPPQRKKTTNQRINIIPQTQKPNFSRTHRN